MPDKQAGSGNCGETGEIVGTMIGGGAADGDEDGELDGRLVEGVGRAEGLVDGEELTSNFVGVVDEDKEGGLDG